jgi:hypothetical protein
MDWLSCTKTEDDLKNISGAGIRVPVTVAGAIIGRMS